MVFKGATLHPFPAPILAVSLRRLKNLRCWGKPGQQLLGAGAGGELWSPPAALISRYYKQSGGWQLKAGAHHSQPTCRQPRWMDTESGERCRSVPAVPPPRVPSQRPAGGTIPLPLLFQAVDLRLGRSPHLVPLALRVQGLVARAWRRGSKGLRQGFYGLKAREEGLAAHPERQEPGAGLAGVGRRGGSRPHLICSRISTGEAARISCNPPVSMVLGAGGGGARPVAASVCELSPPTARGP